MGASRPVGVYYYFKTKDQLVEAAITAYGNELQVMLSALDRRRTPQARLKGLIRALVDSVNWPPSTAARSGRWPASSTSEPTAWTVTPPT